MPFVYTGQCYATTAEALLAFQKGFPLLGDTVWVWHSASSVDAGGVITYTVVTKSSTANLTTSRGGTITLATCSMPDAPVFDPVAAAALWIGMFTVTMTLWVIAKGSGAILEFFKRH